MNARRRFWPSMSKPWASWVRGWRTGRRGARYCAVTRRLVPQPTLIPVSTTLPPAERRRAVRVVQPRPRGGPGGHRGIAGELTGLPTVFASSGGDTRTCHELLQTLATADRQLSPTRFHNSVHNVAAGYWSIATGDTASYTMVCAYDGSFAAGLLEASSLVATSEHKVLLVAYDLDYPTPLREKRADRRAVCGRAAAGADGGPGAICRLACSLGSASRGYHEPAGARIPPAVAPAARALPLLESSPRRGPDARASNTLMISACVASVTPCG